LTELPASGMQILFSPWAQKLQSLHVGRVLTMKGCPRIAASDTSNIGQPQWPAA